METGSKPQRIVIFMLDGLGTPAYEASPMPFLKRIAAGGFFRHVQGVFPSVTNVNNVSICCGAWPDEHGISANSYYDPESGTARYMNSADLIRAKTIFQRAEEWGVRSALLTSKKKTAELFRSGTAQIVAAEEAPREFVSRYGAPPDIYSAEINEWLLRAAVDILERSPDTGLLYVHTTDFPMHAWGEGEPEFRSHAARLDALVESAAAAAPDAAFLVTADHGMNQKRRCCDLAKTCGTAGAPVRFVLSPERDYYVRHHRNFTGCAWVWLQAPSDRDKVYSVISGLQGVESVLEREEAASQFHVDGARIGDLVVLGDIDTMFGELEDEWEELPPSYRAHGSLHEMDVPLIVHNLRHPMPEERFFRRNFDLTRFLFRV